MASRRRPPLRLLRLANPVVRLVLRSPAHRLLSGSLMLVTYRGRHTGRVFTIPVLYVRAGDGTVALAATPEAKQWWRTFRSPTAASLLIQGRVIEVEGRVLHSVEARAALRDYLRRFPRSARTLGAGADADDATLDAAARAVVLVSFAIAAAV
jgi:hypothetical protein